MAGDHQHRRDEERDLETTPNRDAHRDFHAVLQGEHDGAAVLGGIAHHGDHDDADEDVGHAERGGGVLHRIHQDLADRDDGECGGGQRQQGALQAPAPRGLVRLAGEKLFVRMQRKDEVQAVSDQEHAGDCCTRPSSLLTAAIYQRVEGGGHYERDRGHRQRRGLGARSRHVEVLVFVLESPGENGGAEHEEEVADDATRERGLHHGIETLTQGHAGDDQLGGIAEGGVEQAAGAFAGVARELIGGAAQPSGERNYGEASGQEDERVLVHRDGRNCRVFTASTLPNCIG